LSDSPALSVMANHITYFRPSGLVSFSIISEQHIKQLRKSFNLFEGDIQKVPFLMRYTPKLYKASIGIFHPIWFAVNTENYKDLLPRIKQNYNKIVGFETSDTTQINPKYVEILNAFDLILVPSSFAKKVFTEDGVTTRVEVFPHGLSDLYFQPKTTMTSDLMIQDLRKRTDFKILFFNLHSWFRKGKDLLEKAISIVEGQGFNPLIVVRKGQTEPLFSAKNVFTIERELSFQSLIELYDSCDMLALPSRGGGFELNGLEANARGLPIIFTANTCSEDYKRFNVFPINSHPSAKVFSTDHVVTSIHVGSGYQCDPKDLAEKILYIRDHLAELRETPPIEDFGSYQWDKLGERLRDLIGELI
jgi:glycosyltransferase involved in cell wall biosynthesis